MIAFGLECLWWDDAVNARVERVSTVDTLWCPHCGGRCELHVSRASFLQMALRFELTGFVGHRDLMTWSQGKCFKTRAEAWQAYRARPLMVTQAR